MDAQLKEPLLSLCQWIFCVAEAADQIHLFNTRQPFSIMNAVGCLRKSYLPATVVHPFEEWGLFGCFKAVLDESLGELFQEILNIWSSTLCF